MITTLSEALAAGYVRGDMKYQRGYVSRRADIGKSPVHVAGGRRKGELYVLLPSWRSSIYCMRQYLYKKEGKK